MSYETELQEDTAVFIRWCLPEPLAPEHSLNIVILVFAEDLTETGSGSQSLTGVRKAEAHVVAASEGGEEEEEEEVGGEEEEEVDLNCLQRSWTPSWMPTMPKYAQFAVNHL